MLTVITAGGKGTRVAAVDNTLPKPLLPIAGKPVLVRQIEFLARQGFKDIVLTVGYLAYKIRERLGDGSKFGVHIDYIEEKEPFGTAGALYYLKGKIEEDFLLINGDIIFDVDLWRLLAFHKKHKALATLLVHRNDHPYDSGIVMCDTEGLVTGWLSKEDPKSYYSNCVNSGIHVLAPAVLERLTSPRKTDLDRDLLKPLIGERQLYALLSSEYVKDMGTPERIKAVERDLASGLVAAKSLGQRRRCVFLDRDGTINKYVGYVRSAEDLELLPGVAAAIRCLNIAGYLVIVVTNQPVIARGELDWDGLRIIHNKMETLLGQEGAYVDAIYVCPHHPDCGFVGERREYKIDCKCRKPKPGLLQQAALDYNIDLSSSIMIGDSLCDIAAGKSAGCKYSFLLQDGLTLGKAVEKILKGHTSLSDVHEL